MELMVLWRLSLSQDAYPKKASLSHRVRPLLCWFRYSMEYRQCPVLMADSAEAVLSFARKSLCPAVLGFCPIPSKRFAIFWTYLVNGFTFGSQQTVSDCDEPIVVGRNEMVDCQAIRDFNSYSPAPHHFHARSRPQMQIGRTPQMTFPHSLACP